MSGPVHGLLSRARPAAQPGAVAGYGPLVDDPKGMLALPEGFSYRVVTQAGKTRLYSDHASPGIHDGAAAFAAPDGNVLVVLNHEVRGGPDDGGAVPHLRGYTWREDAGGGCTVVKTTPDGELIWETDKDGHGYVFEVDPVDLQANRDPRPIRALSRFVHEACCVDPDTLTIYLTEDTSNPYGTVYRWTPPTGFRGRSGALKALDADAGELAAMAATDQAGTLVDDLDQGDTVGTSYTVEWVPVADRDARQGSVRSIDGITRAKKLEGAWWADHDGAPGAYLVSSFSDSHRGQIWHYDPTASTLTLTTVFAVEADGETVEAPDNIVAAPFGGLIVSTDGDGDNHLAGVADDGTAFPIARSQMGSEFTGPTFSPDGTVLFAGIQQPGTLFAITGPWTGPGGDRAPARSAVPERGAQPDADEDKAQTAEGAR
ncbi:MULTISPECIES: alkaline phosphatase PhoX [unclassified Pseudonocardia]|uniref:alkaline phosphatase PhoX n=1 Tax=unclassified Pseudonocardia TaxID=2619320 RepID=UPI00094B360A|nr:MULTISPECIES: alkaline phosphatase PhoX [unclassified Pseudonocardia]